MTALASDKPSSMLLARARYEHAPVSVDDFGRFAAIQNSLSPNPI
jgi:hypothetical protein